MFCFFCNFSIRLINCECIDIFSEVRVLLVIMIFGCNISVCVRFRCCFCLGVNICG